MHNFNSIKSELAEQLFSLTLSGVSENVRGMNMMNGYRSRDHHDAKIESGYIWGSEKASVGFCFIVLLKLTKLKLTLITTC